MLTKFPSDKINDTKNALFFLSWAPTPTHYKSWSTRFVSLKAFVGFSIFDSISFLLVYIFVVQQKVWSLWFIHNVSSLSKYVIDIVSDDRIMNNNIRFIQTQINLRDSTCKIIKILNFFSVLILTTVKIIF